MKHWLWMTAAALMAFGCGVQTGPVPSDDLGAAGAEGGTEETDPILDRDELLAKIEQVADGVLLLFCDGAEGHGTGALLADGRIWTAAHVIDGDCYGLTAFYRGDDIAAVGFTDSWTVEYPVNGWDAVIIGGMGWDRRVSALPALTPVLDWAPTVGEPLVTVGYPGELALSASDGIVLDTTISTERLEMWDRPEWVGGFTSDDQAMEDGSSGSPVFDRAGRWVATHVGSTGETPKINIRLPLRE